MPPPGLCGCVSDDCFQCAFLSPFCLWLSPFCSVPGCPCLSCVRRYVPVAPAPPHRGGPFLFRVLSLTLVCVMLRSVAAIHLIHVALDALGSASCTVWSRARSRLQPRGTETQPGPQPPALRLTRHACSQVLGPPGVEWLPRPMGVLGAQAQGRLGVGTGAWCREPAARGQRKAWLPPTAPLRQVLAVG